MQKTTGYVAAVLVIAVVVAAIYIFGFRHAQNTNTYPTTPQTTLPTTSILQSSNISAPQSYYYSPPNVSIVADNDNNFTFKAYSLLENESGNESSNIFFSPFSIFAALSMTAQGARGSTLTQMDDVIGLPGNQSVAQSGFESLLNSLGARRPGFNLSIADAVWIEKAYNVSPQFSSDLTDYYAASLKQADFVNNASGETTNINNWVANKTNNRITNLIPQGSLTAKTKLVLVNAIYFKAKWASPFPNASTQRSSFYISPSRNVSVEMMSQELDPAYYYSNSDMQALELNYQGDNASMLVLLPTGNGSISALEGWLSPTNVSTVRAAMAEQDVIVELPRFNMTTQSIDISQLLVALGMAYPFSPSTANFTGINSTAVPGSANALYISNVFHKAFINVNESGTEAAAATAVVLTTATAVHYPPPPSPKYFIANHPFIFLIIDNRSGAVLFMGKVSNPATTIAG